MILLPLDGRSVADDGSVVCTYDLLVDMARDGKDISACAAFADDRIDRYNSISKLQLRIWVEDGTVTGPPDACRRWNTPEPFASVDVAAACVDALNRLGLDRDEYVARLAEELDEMDARGMTPLVKHLMWMVHDWKKRSVVWGVGRGSSCASLVLYLIGLHRVDPVKYGIPASEFMK